MRGIAAMGIFFKHLAWFVPIAIIICFISLWLYNLMLKSKNYIPKSKGIDRFAIIIVSCLISLFITANLNLQR